MHPRPSSASPTTRPGQRYPIRSCHLSSSALSAHHDGASGTVDAAEPSLPAWPGAASRPQIRPSSGSMTSPWRSRLRQEDHGHRPSRAGALSRTRTSRHRQRLTALPRPERPATMWRRAFNQLRGLPEQLCARVRRSSSWRSRPVIRAGSAIRITGRATATASFRHPLALVGVPGGLGRGLGETALLRNLRSSRPNRSSSAPAARRTPWLPASAADAAHAARKT